MPIKNIKIGQTGLVDVEPKFDYILTDDTTDKVLTTGYLNHSVEAGYSFVQGDIVCVITQETPTSRKSSGTYQVDHNGNNWSLIPLESASDGGSSYFNVTQFMTGGDFTFSPNALTTKIIVELVGGGAGGYTGLATDPTQIYLSGAGGNGGYLKALITDFYPEYTFSLHVGTGGAGASADNVTPPAAGDDTTFGQTSPTWVIAAGGGQIPDVDLGLTDSTVDAAVQNGENGVGTSTGGSPTDFTVQILNPNSTIGTYMVQTGCAYFATTNQFLLNQLQSTLYNFGMGGYPQGLQPATSIAASVAGARGVVNIYEFS